MLGSPLLSGVFLFKERKMDISNQDRELLISKLKSQRSTLTEVCLSKDLNSKEVMLVEAGYEQAVQFLGYLLLEAQK